MKELKSAIVTGPTGVLGTALIKKLAQEQVETYAICHPGSERNQKIIANEYIHKIECELEHIKNLQEMINKPIDAFFHFAWLGTSKRENRMDMYLQNKNVKLALDSATVAHSLGCKVFIGAGSQAEYGRIEGIMHSALPAFPISGYGMAKLCAGQMTRELCKIWGMRHIWARVVSVYGVGDGQQTLVNYVIHKLLAGEKPNLTAGEQMWDYLFSDDAAAAFYQMMKFGKDGAIYVLGNGKSHSLRHFMEMIRNEINPQAELGFGEIPYLRDQAMHLEVDITELKRDLGWTPQVSFSNGIKKILENITE